MSWWFVLLGVSVLLNLFSVWYIRELLIRFSYVSGGTDSFFTSLKQYEEHLDSVYELPVFYGDSTLEGLIRHTKDVREDVRFYRDLFNVNETQELFTEEENIDG